MDSSKSSQGVPFIEAVFKRKLAQICENVGYQAITQVSMNILVDLYERIIFELSRHCKDAANRNRRSEVTLTDLIKAFDFVGISVHELKDHVEKVKLPFPAEIEYDEAKPSNRVQRNLLVDDLLEEEKNTHPDDQDDSEVKASGESGLVIDDNDSDKRLLKSTYEDIVSRFPDCAPITADKSIKLSGRIVLVANTKLKITPPLPPEAVPKPSPKHIKRSPKIKGKIKVKAKGKVKTKKEAVEPIPTPVVLPSPPLNDSKESIVSETASEPIKRRTKKAKISVEPVAEPTPAEPPVKVKRKPIPKKRGRKSISPPIEDPIIEIPPADEVEAPKTKMQSKKSKRVVTPLDPSIAEPPSFLPILDMKIEDLSAEVIPLATRPDSPIQNPIKQTKAKKKKKREQFAIVTETVSGVEEKEWFCPSCHGPDNGDLMVQCDTCEEWYHLGCTKLKKCPNDNENWYCGRPCTAPVKSIRKSHTPEIVAKIPNKIDILPEVPVPQPSAPVVASTSHEDACPECNQPDDGTMMIQCDDPFCAKWFHGKCVGLLEEPKEDESWFCKVCVEKQQSAFSRRRRAK